MVWSANNPLPAGSVLLDDVNNGGTFPYDISAYASLKSDVQTVRGRTDELQQASPGTLDLTLENLDGRFTLGSTSGGYGAINVGRQIKVSIAGTQRFQGFVQSWPLAWPSGGDNYAVAQIKATDVLARMAQTTLYSSLEHEYRLAAATQIYMFDADLADSLSTSNYTANAHAPSLLTWDSDLGLFDVKGIGNISRANWMGGTSYVNSDTSIPSAPIGSTVKAACVWVHGFPWDTTGWGGEAAYILMQLLSNGKSLWIYADGLTGNLIWKDTNVGTANVLPVKVLDGRPHLVAVNTSGTAAAIFVDGILYANITMSGSFNSGGSMVTGYMIRDPRYSNGTIDQVPVVFAGLALFPSLTGAQLQTFYQAGVAGSPTGGTLTPTGMLQKICAYAGVAAAVTQYAGTGETASLAWPSLKGQNALQVCQQVAESESGLFTTNAAGVPLWVSRHYRETQYAPVLTFDASALDIGQQLTGDAQYFTNAVTASGPGYSRTAKDATSISKVGTYGTSFNSLQVNGDDAWVAASARLALHLTPALRVGSLTLDLLTLPSLQASVYSSLALGDWVRITGLPSQAGGNLDLCVEGSTEKLSDTEWTIILNASPRSASAPSTHPWILDDPTYSVLDSTTYPAY